VGLDIAAGEPPVDQVYPPSVFAAPAKLVEAVAGGTFGMGHYGFLSVLMEGELSTDPWWMRCGRCLDWARGVVVAGDFGGVWWYPPVKCFFFFLDS